MLGCAAKTLLRVTSCMTSRSVILADGRTLDYRYKRSLRAKHVGLRVSAAGGVLVTIPRGVTLATVDTVVRNKSAWLIRHLERFAALQGEVVDAVAAPLPQVVELPALEETWQVTYEAGAATAVTVRSPAPGRLVLHGAVVNEALCRGALRLWLARRAQAALLPQLRELAELYGFRYVRGVVRGQRTRWGSCSARGTISLNWHLLFLSPPQARYVLLHELCHTAIPDHSPRFWQLLHQLEPTGPELRRTMRRAWQQQPAWLHEPRAPGRID